LVFQNNKVIVNGGVQTIIYFMLSVIVVLFFALGNLNNDVEFRSTIIFMTVFMASYLLLLGLSVNPAIGKYLKGKNVQLFFQHDVTTSHLLWIPIGVIASFGVSLLINNAGFDSTLGSLLAIGASGAIMMAIFFRTGSILIPIIIHGVFNSLVIVLSSPLLNLKILSNTPIPIPEIGISFGTLNSLASESIYQLFLVAPSEEMFKMLILAFVLYVVKNKFDSKSIWVYVGGAISVSIWTVYHMIQAL
jgi:membrane protease YdiL (CAAX protease family)